MNFNDVRASSRELAMTFGFHVPARLPLLDDMCISRSNTEIIDRALILSVVVASSYGLEKDSALQWLEQESLLRGVSHLERDFLMGADESSELFQGQVEALCAFAWSLNMLPNMDFSTRCPDHLVSIYPDFISLEPTDRFRNKATLRSNQELVAACDAAYCLHWGLNQSLIDGVKPKRSLSRIVVTARRRALEWLLGKDDWDEVVLDT